MEYVRATPLCDFELLDYYPSCEWPVLNLHPLRRIMFGINDEVRSMDLWSITRRKPIDTFHQEDRQGCPAGAVETPAVDSTDN